MIFATGRSSKDYSIVADRREAEKFNASMRVANDDNSVLRNARVFRGALFGDGALSYW